MAGLAVLENTRPHYVVIVEHSSKSDDPELVVVRPHAGPMHTVDHILQVQRRFGSGQGKCSAAAREVGIVAEGATVHVVVSVAAVPFKKFVALGALGAVHYQTSGCITGNGLGDHHGVAGQS